MYLPGWEYNKQLSFYSTGTLTNKPTDKQTHSWNDQSFEPNRDRQGLNTPGQTPQKIKGSRAGSFEKLVALEKFQWPTYPNENTNVLKDIHTSGQKDGQTYGKHNA